MLVARIQHPAVIGDLANHGANALDDGCHSPVCGKARTKTTAKSEVTRSDRTHARQTLANSESLPRFQGKFEL